MAKYLGIVRDGEYLLQSVEIEEGESRRANEGRARAERAMDLARRGWHGVYPHSLLTIERLSRRDARGWEIEAARQKIYAVA